MKIISKLSLPLIFSAYVFHVCNAAYAGDVVSIPLQPKTTKINHVAPVFFSKRQPGITVMANDPVFIGQANKTLVFKNNSKLKSGGNFKPKGLGQIKKPASVSSSQVNQDVETINFPISALSMKVTNSGVNFVFSDVTDHDENGTSNLLTLSPTLRRLQVEAARQAAFKSKR